MTRVRDPARLKVWGQPQQAAIYIISQDDVIPSTQSQNGTAVMATRILEGGQSKGRLKNRKTIRGRTKACGAQGAVQPLLPLVKEARG